MRNNKIKMIIVGLVMTASIITIPSLKAKAITNNENGLQKEQTFMLKDNESDIINVPDSEIWKMGQVNHKHHKDKEDKPKHKKPIINNNENILNNLTEKDLIGNNTDKKDSSKKEIIDNNQQEKKPTTDTVTTNNTKNDWSNLNGKWYYFNEDGSAAVGWKSINKKWYYLNKTGEMLTGWQNVGGNWYYLNSDGSMAVNWRYVNKHWYYLNQSGAMATGWKSIGGNWYYLNSDGSMAINWRYVNGSWYYFNPSGAMATGWKLIGGNWYYLNNSGSMISDCTKEIAGAKYKFYKSGAMYSNVWLSDNEYIRPDGVITNVNSSMSHSLLQYNLFKYMTNPMNDKSVHEAAIRLHGGVTSNNCVFFTSEALRRLGVNIPTSTSYTTVLEGDLAQRGWTRSYDLKSLKLGDVVFCGQMHVYTFMGWINNEYGYIVDNQAAIFGSSLHKRDITKYNNDYETYGATHFYHL